jgi:ABC-2 type transport system ATP-binding protein
MMNNMYAVETKDLTKSFNGYKAVDSLNLRVPEGSIYGFLGPNGAGKTTTIKMLTGLSKPTAGHIKICDKEVSFGSLKNRGDIGFLPDVPSFYDWMKPKEFLTFCGELFSIDKAMLKMRVDYLLDLVGLKGVDKKIRGFSRGMKQRLGIAQALINEPRVLFLDEPTSALDPIGRKEVMDIIAQLAGKVTVFFSTHILSDVERICDKVVILNKGIMCVEDSIENLRHSFSYHTIVLEVEPHFVKELMESLSQLKWVNEIELQENGELKIKVNNMLEGQINIPRILCEKSIPIKKFDIEEATLEDIFLKVVNV